MKDLLELFKTQLAKEETKRYLKFLALPLVTVILIVIIVIADKPAGPDGDTASVGTQTSGETTEGTTEADSTDEVETNESQPEEIAYKLSEAELPEITELMERYLKARRTCDRAEIAAVYGGTYSGEGLDTLMARLEEEVKFYQDFQNVVCRTVSVPGTGSYVVYASFDIKFRQAENMAPTMIACLVKQAADNSYYLEGAMTPEESAMITEVNHTDEVQALAKQVNSALRSALEMDSNLLSVYNTLTGKGNTEEESASEETTGAKVSIADPEGEGQEAGNEAETASGESAVEPPQEQ